MKSPLVLYRIIHGLSVAVVLSAVAQDVRIGRVVTGFLPTWFFACALAAVFATFAFRRLPASILWILTLLLVGVITWHG